VHVRAAIFKKEQASEIINSDPWIMTGLTGKQIKRASLDFDQRTGSAQVILSFNGEGAKLFDELTKKNIGKPIAIYLDGKPISIPTVQVEIPSGEAVISGNFTVDEAKTLAQRLQAGALPVPIELIAQQSVGPTLGAQSVADSLKAGLIGFLLVVIFMVLYYRIPGLLADVALLFYAALTFAIFKIIPVTLSLSGIAGFILSIGVAVDANVLVFERLKEEYATGKPMSLAIEEAFKRSWTSIRDGNATALITCFVLYLFTSSLIKGFALTLAIGVLVSMFTAITVTRTIFRLIATTGFARRFPWLFLKKRAPSQETPTV
jgi:preprotein translocase subunit SecD